MYNFTAGNHLIALKVTTVNGCTDSSSRLVIFDSIKAGFSIINPKICGDTGTVRFTNSSKSRFEKQNIPVNDPSYGWNELVNGIPVNSTAAFVSVQDVICKDGQEFNLKGTIMLAK